MSTPSLREQTGPGRDDRFLDVNGLEIHYSHWGSETDPVVLCLHGFSRTGRDFDVLAHDLRDRYRVICPDLPGRGWSQWSRQPHADYRMERYQEIMTSFCDRLGLESLRWIGTSMGGSLGIQLAGGALQDVIHRLVINDSGPGESDATPDGEGAERILSYLADPPAFDNLGELESYYREIYEPFSAMSDAEWRRFTVTSARRRGDGRVMPNYDPRTVEPFVRDLEGISLWDDWERIKAPVLVLRGEDSDILSRESLAEMRRRGPVCEVREVPDCGHAPMLNTADQIEPIRKFLTD